MQNSCLLLIILQTIKVNISVIFAKLQKIQLGGTGDTDY